MKCITIHGNVTTKYNGADNQKNNCLDYIKKEKEITSKNRNDNDDEKTNDHHYDYKEEIDLDEHNLFSIGCFIGSFSTK